MDPTQTELDPFALGDIDAQLDALTAKAEAVEGEPLTGSTPTEDSDPGEAQAFASDQAEISAELMVEVAEQTVVSIWPYLEYDTATRQRVAGKLAPVLAKRGGEMPPWLLAWKEELQFAGVLSLVMFQTIRQIKEHERQEAQEAEDRARASERQPVTADDPSQADTAAWLANAEPVGNA